MVMKRDEHIIMAFFIGILAGVLTSTYSEFFNFQDYALFVGLTISGSILPDLIEPPKTRFFHSVLVLFFTRYPSHFVECWNSICFYLSPIWIYYWLSFSFTPRCNKSNRFTQILTKRINISYHLLRRICLSTPSPLVRT